MPIAGLQAGAECPACGTGTLYEIKEPGVLIRFIGQAPVRATIYELQKLSCQLCVKLFTAEPPAEAGVPLDHNAVERALKKAILHHKNAMFYKTIRNALVGDVHISLIHTCELCDADASDFRLTDRRATTRDRGQGGARRVVALELPRCDANDHLACGEFLNPLACDSLYHSSLPTHWSIKSDRLRAR